MQRTGAMRSYEFNDRAEGETVSLISVGARFIGMLNSMQVCWLSGMDSNHDKGLQRALCYRYTTGHAASEHNFPPHGKEVRSVKGEVRAGHRPEVLCPRTSPFSLRTWLLTGRHRKRHLQSAF